MDHVKKEKIIYGDFMKETITETYRTIVGNPPYVRTIKGNLFIDFTSKCYDLLENNGELVFVVTYDFLNLTSASKLLNDRICTAMEHPHIFIIHIMKK